MSYTALYRKFRPDSFEDVKGQEAVVTTLKNQISRDRVGHAYLFCGTRGTGKTTIAKIMARALNCEHPADGNPCNVCATCRSIQDGRSMNVIEIDAASNNGVDNIREIREEVAYRPTRGRYKVYIIDEVHMLSTGAFNALLKTLEEPPSYVIFILATTEAHKIPVTILSRCQKYDFKRIPLEKISGRLEELMEKEGLTGEEKAIRYIARAADGSLRDALSLLDQCIAFFPDQKLTYEKVLDILGTVDVEVFSQMVGYLIRGDVSGMIRLLDQMIYQGKDMSQLVADLIWYLRNLLLVKTGATMEDALDLSEEHLQVLKEESMQVEESTIMRYIRVLSELTSTLRYAGQKRVMVEVALIKLCRPEMERDFSSLLDRVRILERQMEEGLVPVPKMARDGREENVKARPKERVVPEKAAPEDLKKIKQNWQGIVASTKGLFHAFLVNAVPRYNGQTGEEKLYIEFKDALGEKYVGDEEAAASLEIAIEQMIGKHIDVVFLAAKGERPGGLADISIDDILRDRVHMDIETEEI